MSTLAKLTTEELAGHYRYHRRTNRPGHAFARPGERPEKTAARDAILRLFSRRAWPNGLKIVTMPGLNWIFERRLLEMRESSGKLNRGKLSRTYIWSIEGDEGIFRSSLANMPGCSHGLAERWAVEGSTCAMRTPLIQRYNRCWFEDYAHLDHPSVDAAWFDFNGPLTERRLEGLVRFWENRVRSYLIVTVLNGRTTGMINELLDTHGSVARLLQVFMPQSSIVEDRRYADTCPMAQVILRRG